MVRWCCTQSHWKHLLNDRVQFQVFSCPTVSAAIYLGKFGLGVYRALDDLGFYQNRLHLRVAGGLGYQWHRHSVVEFILSYAHGSGGWVTGNGVSIVVVGRGILW